MKVYEIIQEYLRRIGATGLTNHDFCGEGFGCPSKHIGANGCSGLGDCVPAKEVNGCWVAVAAEPNGEAILAKALEEVQRLRSENAALRATVERVRTVVRCLGFEIIPGSKVLHKQATIGALLAALEPASAQGGKEIADGN